MLTQLTLGFQQDITELGIVLLFLQLSKKLHVITWPPVPLHVLMGTGKDRRGSQIKEIWLILMHMYYCGRQWWPQFIVYCHFLFLFL